MDDYKKFVEERMEGIYEAYNSVILEDFKKKKDASKRAEFKRAFINYLVFKYENKDIKYEFKNAKTDKEKEALVKKYSKDFEEWSKRQKGLKAVIGVDLAGIGLTAAGATGAGQLMAILAWGGLIKTMVNDYKARDKAREEKYNEKHKK